MACAGSWETKVHDDGRDYEHPEQLLVGADRPRRLPPVLRARLEDAVIGAAKANHEMEDLRPLSAAVRHRLESSLSPPGQSTKSPHEDGPSKKSQNNRGGNRRRKTMTAKVMAAGAAIAAAAAVISAVSAPGIVHRPNGDGRFSAASPANPPLARSGRTKAPAGGSRLSARSSGRSRAGSSPRSTPGKSTPATSHKSAGVTGMAPHPKVGGPTQPPAAVVAPTAVAPPPRLSALSPGHGPTRGGNWVVLVGQDLAQVDAVEFGKARAAHVSVVSAGEVRALAPAHSPGTVNVVAVEPGGRSQISAADRYTFGP